MLNEEEIETHTKKWNNTPWIEKKKNSNRVFSLYAVNLMTYIGEMPKVLDRIEKLKDLKKTYIKTWNIRIKIWNLSIWRFCIYFKNAVTIYIYYIYI